jgi:hypothetical protein
MLRTRTNEFLINEENADRYHAGSADLYNLMVKRITRKSENEGRPRYISPPSPRV